MGNYITEKDRYQIEVLLKEKHSISSLSIILKYPYETLRKEIRRGEVIQRDSLWEDKKVYKADYAQMIHDQNMSHRGRPLKIGNDLKTIHYMEDRMKEKYSPEAIATEMKKEGFDGTILSTKTIYNYVHGGILLNVSEKDLLYAKERKEKKPKKRKVGLNNIKVKRIDERPEEVKNRKTFGHWELDTVVSGQNTGLSCLMVLTERKTRQELIRKLPDHKAINVVKAFDKIYEDMGHNKFLNTFKTITCDNGVEFSLGDRIEKDENGMERTTLYYAHPYSSFERGSNENANRFIRRFYPKGFNFDNITEEDVQKLEDFINNYPRPQFGGKSSNEVLRE